jgi:ferredoxin--NADP+ reductase
MTYVVTQPCCADASCVVACPVNCIHPAPGEPGFADAEMLYVDPDSCVGCGACTTACPVGAIVPDTDLTPEQQPFLALNADYFVDHPHPDRPPLAPVPPQRRLRRSGPVRIAVVGAGPAGMFTTDELLTHPEVTVDVLDRLPTPYGLVRHGVAPDHQRTKAVTDLFARIEDQPGFRYRLGVEVGRDVSHEDLARQYHAVVHAIGAAGSRRLGVPGENLPGSVSATDLVGWYNGHPAQQDLRVPLDHERAVVVGNGNVALDVARMLTASPATLATTDVAESAEAGLGRSRVREVVLLGRRGPSDSAFTVPELLGLRALVAQGRLDVAVDTGGAALDPGDPKAALIAELAALPRHGSAPRVVLRFLSSTVRILGTDRVEGVEVVRDGRCEVIDAGLVVRAIGFRGSPVPGLPFDEATGTVPHDRGRVSPGTYVAGWIKRGPRGFIGTNRSDARETVASILDDLDAGLPEPVLPPSPVLERAWGLAAWRALDAEEQARGAAQGRPRSKLVDLAEMQRVVAARREPPRRPRRSRRPRWRSGYPAVRPRSRRRHRSRGTSGA